MRGWFRYTPLALVASAATPAFAVHYLTIAEAQRACFPQADQFIPHDIEFTAAQVRAIEASSGQTVNFRGQRVWKAQQGQKPLGYFMVDHVIGKHLAIDYAVAINAEGSIHQIEILEYRESYGGEIRNADWRKQFIGKTSASPLQLDRDIRNISGATLSSRHLTDGVKRLLATYEIALRG